MFYSLRKRLSGRKRRQAVLQPQPLTQLNSGLWPEGGDEAARARVYQQSPWVYIAINRIAEAAALVPLQVFRLEGERRLAVERHPLERLLDAPNPQLSRFALMEQTVGMLELTGNAYWLLSGTGAAPGQIWPLRPDRMRVVPDSAGLVRGYVYEIDGQRIPLEAAEVLHFRRWHPANDYYGLSALDAGRLAIRSDGAMAQWNHSAFGQDSGVPAGIVSIRDFVSDTDFERIKREWRQSYGGPQRRTAFLRGGGISWQNIGLSHNELDFLKGREAQRNEILNLFGIPVGLVSENATEANARVAERLFIERTLWPRLVRIASVITQHLLPFWPGEHLAQFEDIRPTDSHARLEEIRTAMPVLSINEVRERYYQLPPAPWGALPAGMAASAPTENSAEATPANAALQELGRWERFTLRRQGEKGTRPFEVRALPAELAFEVAAQLQAADDRQELQGVFREARERLQDS
ncbi:MAG: phage portal protein [Anaerolineaceae bacterium]|nr:phage portal protein [Anaerolineaceae bacterium]MCY3907759.1 phage portal protein [Anaerolineaceae bacterium]